MFLALGGLLLPTARRETVNAEPKQPTGLAEVQVNEASMRRAATGVKTEEIGSRFLADVVL